MKKKILSWISALLSFCLTLCVFGCGEDPTPPDQSSQPQEPETAFNELVVSLAGDEFTDPQLNSASFGLSAPEDVGVDQEKFENEVLYAVPGDDAFADDCIFTLREGDGVAQMDAVLARAKEKNVAGHPVKIKLPGQISFDYADRENRGAQLFSLDGFDGLYVEGNGTEITIENDGDHFCGLFSFTDCTNVFLYGFSVDYARPSVFTGTVEMVDAENRTITLEIMDSEYAPETAPAASEAPSRQPETPPAAVPLPQDDVTDYQDTDYGADSGGDWWSDLWGGGSSSSSSEGQSGSSSSLSSFHSCCSFSSCFMSARMRTYPCSCACMCASCRSNSGRMLFPRLPYTSSIDTGIGI